MRRAEELLKRLPARAWLLLQRGGKTLAETSGTRDAAQVAFYVLLSLPAGLLIAVWGASSVLDDPGIRQDIVDAIVDAFPLEETGRADVEDLLDKIAAGAGAIGLVGILGLLYSASNAMSALRHAVNEAFCENSDRRPFVPGKALDVAATLVVVPVLVAALTISLSDDIPAAFGESPLVGGAAGFFFAHLLPGAIVFGLLLGVYTALPAADSHVRNVWPGAVVGLVGLVLVRAGAEAYFSVAGGSAAVYGAIGAAIVIAFSIQLNAIAIVYGAHVASAATRFPGGEAIDREIERSRGEPVPLRRKVWDLVRSLFVKRPERR